MAVLHRALFTWFLLLIFMILVVLRLDEKTSWNWFIVFIPMWIFDSVLLAYVLLKLITHCKQLHQKQQLQSRDLNTGPFPIPPIPGAINTGTGSSGTSDSVYISATLARRGRFNRNTSAAVAIKRRLMYLCGILVKIAFQAILCLKLENFQELSLYYVFVPLWIVLISTSVDVFGDLVILYR
ncbi:Transmembrane protein 60 [Chamberlinius hualienensis]